jgi:uncharacterized membrane protein YfcA
MTLDEARPRRATRDWIVLILIGLAAGFLSGFFGVGGGTLIVPALVLILGFDQRLATGTSLAAIIPTAIVGVIGYVQHGSVAWLAGGILIVGAVVGAWIGTALLHRISQWVLRWIFIAFLVVSIIQLFLIVPDRGAEVEITVLSGLLLLVLGLVTGVLSGLIGVGGGVVIVPALTVFFGYSDLIAKGTSLLVMIPTTVTSTIGNVRRKNLDMIAAGVIGLAAIPMTFLGVSAAVAVAPQTASILFALYLTFVAGQMAYKAIKSRKK